MSIMKNVTIGQYFPGSSPVHRLDPRTKLMMAFAYIIVLFLLHSGASYLVLAVASLGMIVISGIPLKLVLREIGRASCWERV